METINFKEELNKRIEEAQKAREEAKNQALMGLLDNSDFLEKQRHIVAVQDDLNKLGIIMSQLNTIEPFVAKDGRKFKVNVFPISIFGPGYGQVMGILVGSRSAFIDEKMLEYSAITGISPVEFYEAQEAIGSPAYYANGEVHEATYGDFGKLQRLLPGIFLKLGLNELEPGGITKDKYDLWFSTSEAKALRQLNEYKKMQEVSQEMTEFTLD